MSDVHPLQSQALREALELAGEDGLVDVFGPKEHVAPLLAHERACGEPVAGRRVTYHPNAVQLGDGSYACGDCLKLSGEFAEDDEDTPAQTLHS